VKRPPPAPHPPGTARETPHEKIFSTLGAAAFASLLAAASPAVAYGGMDEELHAELVALGLEEETIAMFGEDHAAEIEGILADEDDAEAKRARILALLPEHDEEHAAD
jgi:hypothetical protein